VYGSVIHHLGVSHSRRDDLISLGYMFIHFLRGSLPWQDIKVTSTLQRKYQRVLERKQATEKILFDGYPAEFREYFKYCSSLGLEEQPHYR